MRVTSERVCNVGGGTPPHPAEGVLSSSIPPVLGLNVLPVLGRTLGCKVVWNS